jgi:hypothetical protein
MDHSSLVLAHIRPPGDVRSWLSLEYEPCSTPVARAPLRLASQQIVGDFALQRTGLPMSMTPTPLVMLATREHCVVALPASLGGASQ